MAFFTRCKLVLSWSAILICVWYFSVNFRLLERSNLMHLKTNILKGRDSILDKRMMKSLELFESNHQLETTNGNGNIKQASKYTGKDPPHSYQPTLKVRHNTTSLSIPPIVQTDATLNNISSSSKNIIT